MAWKALRTGQGDAVIDPGTPFTYTDEDKMDNRTAFGKALKDIADRNISKGSDRLRLRL